MTMYYYEYVSLLPTLLLLLPGNALSSFVILDPNDYEDHFVEHGNPCPQQCGVVNASTFAWAQENLPFFDSSDQELVDAYYYRIKTLKSHIIKTEYVDAPFVLSEFGPSVHWGGA